MMYDKQHNTKEMVLLPKGKACKQKMAKDQPVARIENRQQDVLRRKSERIAGPRTVPRYGRRTGLGRVVNDDEKVDDSM